MTVKLYYGLPGSGKSTIMHDEVKAQANAQRFFVVDHDDSWGSVEAGDEPVSDEAHDEKGNHILWRGSPPPNLYVINQGQQLLDVLEEIPEAGVFVFRGFEPLDVAQLVTQIGDAVYVDDEIDKSARYEGWKASPLRAIVHEGRHLRCADGAIRRAHIMGACRRPQNLVTDLTDIADEFYIFRIKGSRTLSRLKADSLLDNDSDWEIVKNLPPFHFLHQPSGTWKRIVPLGKVAIAPDEAVGNDFKPEMEKEEDNASQSNDD